MTRTTDVQVRGVVFTSGLAREIFTAGNDLAELYAPKTSLERYTQFWTVSTTFLARLLRSPLVTVSPLRQWHRHEMHRGPRPGPPQHLTGARAMLGRNAVMLVYSRYVVDLLVQSQQPEELTSRKHGREEAGRALAEHNPSREQDTL